jgi:hypothetical protein
MKKTLLAVLSLTAVSLAGVNGQTILVGWDFDPLTGGSTNYGPSPLSPTVASANLTIAGLTRGSGLGTTGSGAANAWGGMDAQSADLTGAINGNDFASFSITPSAEYSLSFSSINSYNIRRSTTGPTTGQWQYQIGSNSYANIGSSITWGSTTASSGNSQAAIDLSGISDLQNVAPSTTVTFRVVTWGASGTGTWYFNDPTGSVGEDFSVSGTLTAVPEPSTWALIGLGSAFVLWRMRRKVAI